MVIKRTTPIFLLKQYCHAAILILTLFLSTSTMGNTGKKVALSNSGFEKPCNPIRKKGCYRYIVKDWDVALNSGEDACGVRWSNDAHSGEHSLELIAKKAKSFTSASQTVAVQPGQKVSFSVFTKGFNNVKGYVRFFFYNKNSKKVSKYKSLGIYAKEQWQKFETQFTIPDGAHMMKVSLENLLSPKPASILFDDATLKIIENKSLQNTWIRANINAETGGCISEFFANSGDKNLTRKNSSNVPGGLMTDILPGNVYPGQIRSSIYDCTFSKTGSIKVSRKIRKEKLAGLVISKTFSLSKDSSKLNIEISLTNTSPKTIETPYRIQNILRRSEGTYTWPTKDWLQAIVIKQKTSSGSWAVDVGNLCAGWIGKSFSNGNTLAFTFENEKVEKAYSYFDDKIETIEWYYRPVNLESGQTWQTKCTITVASQTGPVFHAGEKLIFGVEPLQFPHKTHQVNIAATTGLVEGSLNINEDKKTVSLDTGKTVSANSSAKTIQVYLAGESAKIGKDYRVLYEKPVELPKAEEQAQSIPGKLKNVFPFGIDGPPLSWPESSGNKGSNCDNFWPNYERIMLEGRKAYFNFFYAGRLSQKEILKNIQDADGKNLFGELALKYGVKFATDTLLFRKKDVDLEKFEPILHKRLKSSYSPECIKFLNKYQDQFLCALTADETFAKNIPAMLKTHDELGKLIPKDTPMFPYLNHSRLEYIPYVPVFFIDHYPINRKSNGGRNPWLTAYAVRDAVNKCGKNVPVWFMQQGFGYFKGIYGFPTPAETRLMSYIAVANGAKGVIFHGWQGQMWSWLYNYGYPYNLYGNLPYYPLWEALAGIGKELTAIGPELLDTEPETSFKEATVKCDKYNSSNGLYNGPAITVRSLKRYDKKERFIVVQNMNVEKSESGKLIINKDLAENSTLYDLTNLQKLFPINEIEIKLKAGDSRFFFLVPKSDTGLINSFVTVFGLFGSEEAGIETIKRIFHNRYKNENDRLQIDIDIAQRNGLELDEVINLAGKAKKEDTTNNSEKAYLLICNARNQFDKILEKSSYGKFLKEWHKAAKCLSNTQFSVMNYKDLFVPEKAMKSTPRYRKFKHLPEKIAILRNSLAKNCFEYLKMDRAIRNGNLKENKKEMNQIIKNIFQNAADIKQFIKLNSNKVVANKPFEE